MTPAEDKRIDALDGLRGLAALTVVVSHLSNQTGIFGTILGKGAGQLGVMLFFALSGFLMARLYMSEPPTGLSVLHFHRRRAARVVPLYFVLVGASFLLTVGLNSGVLYRIDRSSVLEHLLFIHGESVLWTIPVEVQFYAVFPLIWWATSRWGTAWIMVAIVGLAAMTFAGMTTAAWLPHHLQYFLLGIVIANSNRRVPGWLPGIMFAAYVLAFPRVVAALGFEIGDVWRSPIYLILIGLLLYAAAGSDRSFLSWPAMRYLGNISYSLYLLHFPIMAALAKTSLVDSTPLYIIASLSASILAAGICYRAVELPARKFLNGRSARRIAQPLAAASGLATASSTES